MKLIDYLNEVSPDMEIRLYGEDGETLFLGHAGQIQDSIMFNTWNVVSHNYHTDGLRIWIA